MSLKNKLIDNFFLMIIIRRIHHFGALANEMS